MEGLRVRSVALDPSHDIGGGSTAESGKQSKVHLILQFHDGEWQRRAGMVSLALGRNQSSFLQENCRRSSVLLRDAPPPLLPVVWSTY